MNARIELVFEPGTGEWRLPECGCSFHFFEGAPAVEVFEIIGAKGMQRLTGIVAPHIHLCDKHQ